MGEVCRGWRCGLGMDEVWVRSVEVGGMGEVWIYTGERRSQSLALCSEFWRIHSGTRLFQCEPSPPHTSLLGGTQNTSIGFLLTCLKVFGLCTKTITHTSALTADDVQEWKGGRAGWRVILFQSIFTSCVDRGACSLCSGSCVPNTCQHLTKHYFSLAMCCCPGPEMSLLTNYLFMFICVWVCQKKRRQLIF